MNIALVAHDGRKKELLEWIENNLEEIKKHNLFATGTPGKLIQGIEVDTGFGGGEGVYRRQVERPLKNKVTCLHSGPLGGDQEVGAMIARGEIDVLIFFCDNLIAQGHQTDVSALSRLASLYNIAFATNRTTADMILSSPLLGNPEYHRVLPGIIEKYENRAL